MSISYPACTPQSLIMDVLAGRRIDVQCAAVNKRTRAVYTSSGDNISRAIFFRLSKLSRAQKKKSDRAVDPRDRIFITRVYAMARGDD